jgi:hypothetical protein
MGGTGADDAGSTDLGGMEIPDVYDCDDASFTSCDSIICSTNLARAAIEFACRQPAAPAGCDGTVQACFDDYLACVIPVCPPGVDFADADDLGVEACADQLDACTAPITGD